MALKALDIFKLLPKTNCKKCGCPTCLAFAMKIANQTASLQECPDVTDEARAKLEGAAAPPIRLVTVGAGESPLEIGNETVMFRHEESFYHAPGIGVVISDDLDDKARAARLAEIRKLSFVRVGAEISVNIIAVENVSGDADKFAQTATAASGLGLPLILIADLPAHAQQALSQCGSKRPLLFAANENNWEGYVEVAKEHDCPLAIDGPDLDAVAALATKVQKAGVDSLVLSLGGGSLSQNLQNLTAARRLALKRKADGVGYPGLVYCREDDPVQNVTACVSYIAKYAGIVLTRLSSPEEILPLLTTSQNIYTDPRKPVQVEPKLYSVGAVKPDSPLLITTNFSLTYYTVEGEVEASRVPAYIGVIDTEGTSVLTAFAADKLSSEKVAAFLDSDEVKAAVSHKKVILPGYIAAMSGALRDDSDWEVMVGPREASGISKYLKTVWTAK